MAASVEVDSLSHFAKRRNELNMTPQFAKGRLGWGVVFSNWSLSEKLWRDELFMHTHTLVLYV